MDLPNTYTDVNETNCCGVPNIGEWDKQEFEFRDVNFVRLHTRSFLYMPLNMSGVMKTLQELANKSGKEMPSQKAMILSRDLSPWKAEQLYRVAGPVEGADNVVLSGKFKTMVFEGPYKEVKNWYKQIIEYAQSDGKNAVEIYFFYTTCPKCAKHYGKNYVIALAKIV
jgi:hypothetical protein